MWERVTPETRRLRVPGGWLYEVYNQRGGLALAFVPAPLIDYRPDTAELEKSY